MASPWIARIVLTVLAVEAGVCTAFLADDWTPVRKLEEFAFRQLLKESRDTLGYIVDKPNRGTRDRVVRALQHGKPGRYLRIDITEEREQHFEAFPPSAIDWAIILRDARTTPPGIVAIDYPLTWEDAGEIPLDTLDHQLALYDWAVLCIDLRRAATGQALPDYLRRSSIPLANLRGNPGLLPRVNRLVLPPSATGASNLRFGFRLLESEAEMENSPPAFAVWEDRLIPSFPVALAMARHNVSPEDVEVTLGRSARLGNGPLIPLDEFGRLVLPTNEQTGQLILPESRKIAFTTADELRSFNPSTAFGDGMGANCTLFTDAAGIGDPPWEAPRVLQNIAEALDILPQPGPAQRYPRLPLLLEGLIFLLLAGISVTFLCGRPHLRHLAFPLLILASLAALALLLVSEGAWTPVTPLLACLLAAWLLSGFLSHHCTAKTAA